MWPQLAEDPALGRFADRLNSMPKYVASRTLEGPLAWNATLIEGAIRALLREIDAQNVAVAHWTDTDAIDTCVSRESGHQTPFRATGSIEADSAHQRSEWSSARQLRTSSRR